MFSFARICAVALAITSFTGSAIAGQITQFFPAVPQNEVQPRPESGWRMSWSIVKPQSSSAMWFLQNIEFMKGYKANGEPDWIKVLNNLGMVEMYVPYNDGTTAFYDVSGHQFDFAPARQSYLPRYGVVSAKVEDDNVISEVVDDGVRWMDNQDNYAVRRGQVLRLWATFVAGNYSYTVLYLFSDDGRISVRVGGTAQNYKDLTDLTASVNSATHLHMGAWRMEFDLGDASANRVMLVERGTDENNNGVVAMSEFNNGREGGVDWKPTRYSILRIMNTKTMNRHEPPTNVSYVLKPLMRGQMRTNAPVTRHDFWVSRRRPDAPLYRFVDLPQEIADPQPLADQPLVVWHNVALQHIPRGEDFGPVGYQANDGTAINSYVGFDLVPVHLWHKTPFLNRANATAAATPPAGRTTAQQPAAATPATATPPAAPATQPANREQPAAASTTQPGQSEKSSSPSSADRINELLRKNN